MTDTKCGYQNTTTDQPCRNPATGDDGYCWLKSHAEDGPDGESDMRGAPEENQNARKHGAFSDHFRSDLRDDEIASLNALMAHLDGIDDERSLAAEVAGEALLKYKRSADSRFLREARMWMGDFNLMPNEDTLNLGGSDGNPLNVLVERSEYDGDE